MKEYVYSFINLPIGIWVMIGLACVIAIGMLIESMQQKTDKKTKKSEKGWVWTLRDMREKGFDTNAFAIWLKSKDKDLGDHFNRFADKSKNTYEWTNYIDESGERLPTHTFLSSPGESLSTFWNRIKMPIPIKNQNNQQH